MLCLKKLQRLIAVLVFMQFVAGTAAVRSFAFDRNLRPAPAKDAHESSIKTKLVGSDLAKSYPGSDRAAKDGGVSSGDVFAQYLGEGYVLATVIDDLAYGAFVKKEIDLAKSKSAKQHLSKSENFGAISAGDKFYALYFHGRPLALVRKDAKGELKVLQTADVENFDIPLEVITEMKPEGVSEKQFAVDILIKDYQVLEKRALIPVDQRMTVEFKELNDYVSGIYEAEKAKALKAGIPESQAKEQARSIAKETGLAIAGGKGLSLSVQSQRDGVEVPPGFNVTTAGYFNFIRSNPNVENLIRTKLSVLDTMDDQTRDVVTQEIRDAINERAQLPSATRDEVVAMYHQLNVKRYLATGNLEMARVAVRSSGTKEDMHIESFLPVSSGSQAGQSDTFLNVMGETMVLEKLVADFASLFTDRAVSYRDDATFLMWAHKEELSVPELGKKGRVVYDDIIGKLRDYAKTLNKPEYARLAHQMEQKTSPNPGTVNLMEALEDMIAHETNADSKLEMETALRILKEKASEVVDPLKIGIDVVIMQMAKSEYSGVLFTVNPATKMAGVTQALFNAWYMNNDEMVYVEMDKDGNKVITGTKPCVVSFDVAYGYGENVVGGKVTPDKYIMATRNGADWFVIDRIKGTKLIQMKNYEEVIDMLKDKIPEKSMMSLVDMVRDAVAYDEVGKRINNVLTVKLYGTRYLKADPNKKDETEKDKKQRMQGIAEKIANKIKDKQSEADIIAFIETEFNIVPAGSPEKGIHEEVLAGLVKEAVSQVNDAKAKEDKGMRRLSRELGGSKQAGQFMYMVKETWENTSFDNLDARYDILRKLNLTSTDMHNLSYLLRSRIDKSFTCNCETTEAHQNQFTMSDEDAANIARMGWAITTFYKDMRDVEFAIERDFDAPEDKQIKMYGIDEYGNIIGVKDGKEIVPVRNEAEKKRIKEIPYRLYNVQARPYTAEYAKVNVVRARTEADEKFIEDNGIKPIASGTKGENATVAYTMVFRNDRDVAWHADEIRRLKRAEFSEDERKKLIADGFNPADYSAENPLPIALYLLEADPNHDPIMRLVNSVITKRGGDTCHAAIFCREQGIPAVTGAGEVRLNGKALDNGDAVIVDANNGNIYEMAKDEAKRIPIKFVKFKIKPHAIPGDDDDAKYAPGKNPIKYPKIGQIIAATSAAQLNSPIMLAADSAGNSLTRAEFKGEEIGLNVFAGYGFDMLNDIAAGKVSEPVRVTAGDLLSGKEKMSAAFSKELNDLAVNNLLKNEGFKAGFSAAFGREFSADEMVYLLDGFDALRDIEAGIVKETDIPSARKPAADFVRALSGDPADVMLYAYGLMQRRYNYDYNILSDLRSHPWILGEIRKKLNEKGYKTFAEYIKKEFTTFYHMMGFTIAPTQDAKNRAYDFAQDKIRGMPGSEVFAWAGVNPLVGLRGTSLEIEGVDLDNQLEGNQKILGFLFDAVIDAHETMGNQAWFYVFVRSTRELDVLRSIISSVAERRGKLPKQLGIMIEVPSAALVIDALSEQISQMEKDFAKYGVEHVFYSFGTNDYSHLAGKGDREDPRMKLEVMDPLAAQIVKAMTDAGYFYDVKKNTLPLIDEGADVIGQLIESVVKSANDREILTSLCGEAITALVGRKDYAAAGKIMSILDSFGISMMKVRLVSSMVRYDVIAATKEITTPKNKRSVILDLADAEKLKQDVGVVKGEIIYVDSAEDLLPDVLKKPGLLDIEKEREFLEMQSLESARSTVRTFGKIVVLSKNLVAQDRDELNGELGASLFNKLLDEGILKDIGGNLYIWANLALSEETLKNELREKGYNAEEIEKIVKQRQRAVDNTAEGMEKRGIDWGDLEYAKAILVDADVDLEGWEIFSDEDKSIVPMRVKAYVPGIGAMRKELEGKYVTIDYAAKKIYDGDLSVKQKPAVLRSLPVPAQKPDVETRSAVREDANNVYGKMVFHPLVLLAKDKLDDLAPVYKEYIGKLIEEAEKVLQESDPEKRAWLLSTFEKKIENLPDQNIREDIKKRILPDLKAGKAFTLHNRDIESMADGYFTRLKKDIDALLAGRPVKDFIKAAFADAMVESLTRNPDAMVIHTTTSLNCAEFNKLRGGLLVELVNPNPDYGILGAARALGDFWPINRLELEAFKEVRESLPVEQRRNFGLQITNVRGTQAGAVMLGWRLVLEDIGIIPGKDGLQLGVNIETPSNSLALDKYIEHFKGFGTGLSFITYDTMMLGAAWGGVDIYWNEWRRLATDAELVDFGTRAAWMAEQKLADANAADPSVKRFVARFANDTAGADGLALADASAKVVEEAAPVVSVEKARTMPVPAAINRVVSKDRSFYDATTLNYGNVIRSIANLEKTEGAFVIGANTVFENAGSIEALKKMKDASSVLNVAVWAKNEADVRTLKYLGVDKYATIYVGLKQALTAMESYKIAASRVVLIASDLDMGNIKDEYLVQDVMDFFHKNPELKAVHVSTPRTGEVQKRVNSMPLVFAKAASIIFNDKEAVLKQIKRMSAMYAEKGMLSDEDVKRIESLTTQISDIPLITVEDSIAEMAVTYEETLNKI
jgi:phosphoenolpyruvate synthase/pyruvate phosphate dikinase